MEPVINPYRPGAGVRPPELVGRQAEIDLVDLMVAKSRNRRNDGGLIMFGLRGVGKTVLLNRLQDIVSRAGWVTIQMEARPGAAGQTGARQSLARGVALAGRQMSSRFGRGTAEVARVLSTVASFSIAVGGITMNVGASPSDHRANSGLIEVDLAELVADVSALLTSRKSALAIFIDEMQDLDPELLAALLAVQHKAMQKEWPFYVIGAGLSTLRPVIAEARSYSERFNIREVGALSRDAAEEAIVKPAELLGARYTSEAVELILEEAQGYPFFLQTYGKFAWDLAPDRRIDLDVAVAAVDEGNADLDQGFFPARWDRTTPAERQYLRAIVAVGNDTASTSAVAAHMGMAATSASPVRQSLIEKGIIYASRRGYVSFTVPSMDRFIQRQFAD